MTTETSNARGEWVLVPREPTKEMEHEGIGVAEWTGDVKVIWSAMLAAAPPPAAARGGVRGLEYVPGRLDREAPARVWLQIDTAGDNDERDDAWPGSEHVMWQDESMGGLEIQYVRADLALAAEGVQAGEVADRQAWYEAEIGKAERQWIDGFSRRYEAGDDVPSMSHFVALWLAERTAPLSAPVGVEGLYEEVASALAYIRFGDEDAPEWDGQRVRVSLAQQPAAVDEAMTRRIMSEFHANDPGDVWPPDEQGRLRRKALQDAINNALATQHQEPTT